MNNVQILGNITRDLELKYTQSGVCIGSFGIAYNEKRKQQDGSYGDVTHFFDCTAFGKTAENINSYFRKGSKILIDGSLDYQSWKNQEGKTQSKVGIKVNSFDFIDKKNDTQSNNSQTNNYPPQGQQPVYQPQQQQSYQASKAPIHYEQVPQQRQQPQRPQQPQVIDVDEDMEIPF